MRELRRATAQSVYVGPFISKTDGATYYTPTAIPSANIFVIKNSGASYADAAPAVRTSVTTTGSIATYHALIALGSDDTDKTGRFRVFITGQEASALPVWEDFEVLPESIYDAKYGVVAGTSASTALALTNVTVTAVSGAAVSITGAGANAGIAISGGSTGLGMIIAAGASGDGSALQLQGYGAGAGLQAVSGATGYGMLAQGFTAGAHIQGLTNGTGLIVIGAGTGAGATIDGGTGSAAAGVIVRSNSTGTGIGISVVGAGTNGHAVKMLGGNGGSAAAGSGLWAQSGTSTLTGHESAPGVNTGITAISGSTNGDGVFTQGKGEGCGIDAWAGANGAGYGLDLRGGTGTGTGAGLYIRGAAGNTTLGAVDIVSVATNGNAVRVLGTGTGAGINTMGGTTGAGIDARGGATGIGLLLRGGATSGVAASITTTAGVGISIAAAGGSGVLIAAPTSQNGISITNTSGSAISLSCTTGSAFKCASTGGGSAVDLSNNSTGAVVNIVANTGHGVSVTSAGTSVGTAVNIANSASTSAKGAINVTTASSATTGGSAVSLSSTAAGVTAPTFAMTSAGTGIAPVVQVTAAGTAGAVILYGAAAHCLDLLSAGSTGSALVIRNTNSVYAGAGAVTVYSAAGHGVDIKNSGTAGNAVLVRSDNSNYAGTGVLRVESSGATSTGNVISVAATQVGNTGYPVKVEQAGTGANGAISIVSTGSLAAVDIAQNGTGMGVSVSAAAGHGIQVTAAGASKSGIKVTSSAYNGVEVVAGGAGHGMSLSGGATGNGLHASGVIGIKAIGTTTYDMDAPRFSGAMSPGSVVSANLTQIDGVALASAVLPLAGLSIIGATSSVVAGGSDGIIIQSSSGHAVSLQSYSGGGSGVYVSSNATGINVQAQNSSALTLDGATGLSVLSTARGVNIVSTSITEPAIVVDTPSLGVHINGSMGIKIDALTSQGIQINSGSIGIDVTSAYSNAASFSSGTSAVVISGGGGGSGLYITGGTTLVGTNITPALKLDGSGDSNGLDISGGTTGTGVQISGGATSGVAISASVTGGPSVYLNGGITALGNASGPAVSLYSDVSGMPTVAVSSPSGPGVHIIGRTGVKIATQGGSSSALELTGYGSGSAVIVTPGETGDGMLLNGGSTSGSAIRISANDDTVIIASSGGHGISVSGAADLVNPKNAINLIGNGKGSAVYAINGVAAVRAAVHVESGSASVSALQITAANSAGAVAAVTVKSTQGDAAVLLQNTDATGASALTISGAGAHDIVSRDIGGSGSGDLNDNATNYDVIAKAIRTYDSSALGQAAGSVIKYLADNPVVLAASQPDYAPAKAGDAMALTANQTVLTVLGNVDGNVTGSVAGDVMGSVGSVIGSVGSVAGGVVLDATQSMYAPAKAGDQMDIISIPNATAIAAIQDGLATASDLSTVGTNVSNTKTEVDELYALRPVSTIASQADVLGIVTGTRAIQLATADTYRVPSVSFSAYKIELVFRDSDGSLKNPSGASEISVSSAAGGVDWNGKLWEDPSCVTGPTIISGWAQAINVATGIYVLYLKVDSTEIDVQLVVDGRVTDSTTVFQTSAMPVVETVSWSLTANLSDTDANKAVIAKAIRDFDVDAAAIGLNTNSIEAKTEAVVGQVTTDVNAYADTSRGLAESAINSHVDTATSGVTTDVNAHTDARFLEGVTSDLVSIHGVPLAEATLHINGLLVDNGIDIHTVDGTTLTEFLRSIKTMPVGTVSTITSPTEFTSVIDVPGINKTYVGRVVIFTSGPLRNTAVVVKNYSVGATSTITTDALASSASPGDTFIIV